MKISTRDPLRRLLAITLVGLSAAFQGDARAEDKKEPPPTPRIATVGPFSLVRGTSNHLYIRGFNLDTATAVRLEGTAEAVVATIKSKGKVEVPKRIDPQRIGDSQVEIEFALPPDQSDASMTLVVSTKEGETRSRALVVLDASALIEEKEPNGGFRTAQEITPDKIIRGRIQDTYDVDTFKFQAKAGQQFTAEIEAASAGSPLDSLLTLHDEKGHILTSNDDTDTGPDSLLKYKTPTDGTYYLTVTDANDIGSQAHAYHLTIHLTAQ